MNGHAIVRRIRDFEYVNHFDTQPITLGTKTVFGENLPLGEGWLRLNFRFNNVITIGTGTGAIAESELLIIKNVLIKTSRGETLCDLPGRALYRLAQFKNNTAPRKDAMAAASATYRVSFSVEFADPSMLRPMVPLLQYQHRGDVWQRRRSVHDRRHLVNDGLDGHGDRAHPRALAEGGPAGPACELRLRAAG
jgi:hypothetical protein